MTVEPSGPRGTAAIDKGLALFCAVIRDEGRNSLDDLAEELGLPASTGRRLMAAFERQGLVQRSGRGRRMAGPTLALLAPPADRSRIVSAVARPVLRDLARRLAVTAHLGVLEGDMVTYLVKEQGSRAPVFTREGEQLEAYCSGIGKVLLAHLPAAARDAYLDSGAFVPLTPRTIVDPDALREELARVERRGYAIDDAEIDDAIHCLAVLVGTSETFSAAISITAPRQADVPIDSPALIEALDHAAASISARLTPLFPAAALARDAASA